MRLALGDVPFGGCSRFIDSLPSALPPGSRGRGGLDMPDNGDDRDTLRVRISVLEERLRGLDRALQLQAAEYRRRLDELNHAHAQRVARDADYVLREKFDTFEKQERLWRDQVNETLAALQGRTTAVRSSKDDTRSLWAILIAVASVVAAFVALFWKKN